MRQRLLHGRGLAWRKRLQHALLTTFAAALISNLAGTGCRSSERGFFDFSSEPEGQLITLSGDWNRERVVVEGFTETEVAARYRFGDTCDGYVSQRAPYTLRLEREAAVRIEVESDSSEDLVMVLTGRSGLRCNDDSQGLMPGLQTRLAAGDYSIFVGTLFPEQNSTPFRLVIRKADLTEPFLALSSAGLADEFERLANWVPRVSPTALANLESRVDLQRAAFEGEVPTIPPDLQVRPLLGVHRVDRDQEGELLRVEFESRGEAPLWPLDGACGGFARRRGPDALLRVGSGFEGSLECLASADVEIELAIRGPQNQWDCGGRTSAGFARRQLENPRAGEYAVMVTAIEPEESYRVLLSCTAFGAGTQNHQAPNEKIK